MVAGHSWKMLLAIRHRPDDQTPDVEDSIKTLGSLHLGDISSVIGSYQVLAGVRRLA